MMVLKQEENLITRIIKRDGREVPFDEERIVEAIKKSFQASGDYRSYAHYKSIADDVVRKLYLKNTLAPTVEQVQDIVEETLIQKNHASVAKNYIIYRLGRSRIREMNTRLMRIYEDITFKDSKDSDIKRENANVNCDTAMGAMLKYGSEGAKQFYEMYVLNPEHGKAHKDGDIHIHDLDFLTMTTTCCQIDLLKLFKGGFSTGHGALREPNDILSYSALACIAVQSNQNDQHGGQSVANFDYGLAPGVTKTFIKQYRMDLGKSFQLLAGLRDMEEEIKSVQDSILKKGVPLKLEDCEKYLDEERRYWVEFFGSEKEPSLNMSGDIEKLICECQTFAVRSARKSTDRLTFQAMEALIHNLNTMHSRAGAQTPFSSINYGMDTSAEGRMVVKNVLLALERGLGNGETPIFPIHIFRVKEGVNYNEGEPNYDLFKLACKVSAKRLFPNFSFQDAPFNLKYYEKGRQETEIAYMGCRTRVISNVFDPERETTYGRGNLSFTSINLPRLGIKAEGDIDYFFKSLDEMIKLCVDQLLERFKIQCGKRVRNFPFLMGEGVWIDSEKLGPDDRAEEVLKHGTLTVGFIGLAECLVALVGHHHGESEEARKLGISIVSHMRKRMDEEAEKRKLNFSLIATPAEGLSGRFVKIDRRIYGRIKGITDREYYTNSFHVPVYYKMTAFEKIGIEAPYHELTNAGHITYVELDGDMVKNVEAFERIIRHMKESGIGYGSINHPIDRDPVCGYTGIIGDVCPNCQRIEDDVPFERIRRITGYLVGALDRFNNAKLSEVRDRVKHGVEPHENTHS
ncbi:MAG: anaerobic ribonucleoside triphosphate reductase [Clostridiales bacterium]|jgi:ribonucleoside-triphosphate reductase|nr:anaerobic ribonucleoside triphosphate reductase [Clostridiales bacterium]